MSRPGPRLRDRSNRGGLRVSDRSFKYRVLLKIVGALPAKKLMAAPKEKTQRIFRLAYKGENIPPMSDPELRITKGKVGGSTVLYYKLREPTDRVMIYLVGGGLLKYPQPAQARELIGIAKKCRLNVLMPYFPIIFTGGTLPEVYAMVYELYKRALRKYKPENILFVGGSSGGNLAVGMASYINDRGEGLPQPGKIYAGSPGTLLLTEEERALAYEQEKTDVIMSVKAIDAVWDGMTGGKEVPPYMKYLQLGDYTGVKDVYLSFGGDEVFLAGAQPIKKRLEEFGAHVTLEIGEGMYHSYAMLPLVREADEGRRNYIAYLSR